jgi:LuxR family maltose regulon positive regulatory protein
MTSAGTAGASTSSRRKRTPPEPEQLWATRAPVPAQPIVHRPRLLERLRAGADGPLTLVSAPAGTGKTVLASAWVASHETPGPVTWVTLEDVDCDASTVWSFIVEGLSRTGVDVPRRLPASGLASGDHSFLDSVALGLSEAGPSTLVLDCDGSLSSDAAKGLHYVLRRSNGSLRLVLLSRVDPPLPLHRYRLANTLTEIRLADLAFTKGEARELLAGMAIDLPPSLIDRVTDRTQGWAAGLRFAAMSLAQRSDPEAAVEEFTGDTGTVAEYLLAEVLNGQPAGARELLLKTSIVDVLRPGLAEVLAGPRAQRALAFLVRGNAFLEELPDSPGCYRYHALFRELLRAQLAFEAQALVPELHRAAAEWMAAQGMLEDAVRHAITANAWGDAARYVVDDLAIDQLLVERSPRRLHGLLSRIPSEPEGFEISLVRAALAMFELDLPRCRQHVAEAEELLDHDETVRRPAADMALTVMLLVHARGVGDGEAAVRAAEDAERLLRLQAPERVAAHPELVALVQSSKGRALVTTGQLGAAAEAFAVGSHTAEARGREYPSMSCLGHLALIAALAGQLRKAVSLGEQAVGIQTRAGIPPIWCPAAAEVALAWAHTDTYDLAEARRHVVRAADSVDDDPLPRAMLTLVKARLSRARGDVDGALAMIAEAEAEAQTSDLPAWLEDSLRVEEATLDIVNGNPSLAVLVAEELEAPSSPSATLVMAQAKLASGTDTSIPLTTLNNRATPLATRVNGWLLEASHQLFTGNQRQASRALERSLRLAAPERLRRPFREAPLEVRRLLREDGDLAVRHSWLGEWQRTDLGTTHAVPRQRGTGRRLPETEYPPVHIVAALTEKEREVLAHLAELLTTDEIAGVMFVSVNTVRTHVRNILRKLAASRRNEAVRRARELGILSP